jgi:hypothetical protein
MALLYGVNAVADNITRLAGWGQTYFFSKKVGLTQACPVVVF